jgi:hypothetical protein
LQRINGSVQAVLQQTLSAQERPDAHCEVVAQAPPWGTGEAVAVGVIVGVAVTVEVLVAVAVAVGVAVLVAVAVLGAVAVLVAVAVAVLVAVAVFVAVGVGVGVGLHAGTFEQEPPVSTTVSPLAQGAANSQLSSSSTSLHETVLSIASTH